MRRTILACALTATCAHLVAVWAIEAPMAAAQAAGGPAEDAAAILAEHGVSGGLVVHVGCGDGRLTAALRATAARPG
ncbi:MAG: hypothetical protein ACOY3P_10545, partial [Planctomycetota bacterium]